MPGKIHIRKTGEIQTMKKRRAKNDLLNMDVVLFALYKLGVLLKKSIQNPSLGKHIN